MNLNSFSKMNCNVSVIFGILGWVQNFELVEQEDFLFMEDVKHLCQTSSQECVPAK